MALRTWVRLVAGGKTDPADSGPGMEAELPVRGHILPSKEKAQLGLELIAQLRSDVELKFK